MNQFSRYSCINFYSPLQTFNVTRFKYTFSISHSSENYFSLLFSFQGTTPNIQDVRVVGPSRLELPTSRLSGVRSNHLSYEPKSKHEPQKLNSDKTCQSGFFCKRTIPSFAVLLRKEVIQPHLPIRLPCYDLTPIIEPTFGCVLLAVRQQTSGIPNFHGLTGGVYKARERIHRDMLIHDY